MDFHCKLFRLRIVLFLTTSQYCLTLFLSHPVKQSPPGYYVLPFNSDVPVRFSEAFSTQFAISCKSSSFDMDHEELISYFNSTCVNILDSIAPLKLKCPKTRNQPWLNGESRVLRQKCRQAESKWK